MKKFTLLLSAVLLACATSLWAETYTIAFLTGDNSNSTISASTKVSDVVETNSVDYVASFTSNCAKAYHASKSGVKLGSSSAGGTLEFTLADVCKANGKKMTVKTGQYSKETPTISLYVNGGKTALSSATSGTDVVYSFETAQEVSTIEVSSGTGSNKRSYIATIIVETGAATNTVSVAVAEGQEEMGSVAMSYKANSNAAEWTEATEPVEIAGEGEEEFQFVATPADGYKFAGWTTTGDIELNSLTNATTEGGLATETSVVTANFKRDATLTSLAISGTATKLNYFVGDTFDPAGLVVTATYSVGPDDDVTDQVSWTFDPETFDEAGTASVTVTATIDAISAELTISDIVVVDVDKYALVTNSTLLADGQHIIIVKADATYALSTTQKSYNRDAVAITANDGIIVPTEGVQIITLDSIMVEDAIKWELRVAADSFLYAASTKDNHLKTRKGNSGDTQGQWTISIDAKGVATVKASGTERNWMRYNSNNNLFSCYKEKQEDIAIYARQYTVKVVSNDENMGTVSGDGKYFENNVAELVATPKAGYKLTGWSNNSELTKNEQSLVVTENITITAYFAKGETAIDCTTLAPEVVKTIENGQLVIIRDGVKYNAMGVRLQ